MAKTIFLLDNFDSFTYNLVDQFRSLGCDVRIYRNSLPAAQIHAQIAACPNDPVLVLSPGPGAPHEAGCMIELIGLCRGQVPILGICLGHQAICEVYGGTITYAKQLMHGKQSVATLKTDSPLFKGLPEQVDVGRYHSLALDPDTLPEELEVLAHTEDGEIMAVGHKQYPVYGLQFHPESILTPQGPMMVENFLTL